MAANSISSRSFLSGSEAKSCLAGKRVAFLGDSRIRQLFHSFIKILDPERREDGNKVIMGKMNYLNYLWDSKLPPGKRGRNAERSVTAFLECASVPPHVNVALASATDRQVINDATNEGK